MFYTYTLLRSEERISAHTYTLFRSKERISDSYNCSGSYGSDSDSSGDGGLR